MDSRNFKDELKSNVISLVVAAYRKINYHIDHGGARPTNDGRDIQYLQEQLNKQSDLASLFKFADERLKYWMKDITKNQGRVFVKPGWQQVLSDAITQLSVHRQEYLIHHAEHDSQHVKTLETTVRYYLDEVKKLTEKVSSLEEKIVVLEKNVRIKKVEPAEEKHKGFLHRLKF